MELCMSIGVSVILPVFNGANYLETSVKSILRQTFKDLELIVIDDGSTDNTKEVLTRLGESDSRLLYLSNRTNEGVARCLNRGLGVAQGEFIARMDVDDVSLPSRLEKQIDAFRKNNKLVLVGSNATLVDEKLSFIRPSFVPLDDWSIRCTYLISNPFIHSSVMFCGFLVRELGIEYDASVRASIDYEMWSRVLDCGEVQNLPDQLILLRKHQGAFSVKRSDEQTRYFRISRNHYRRKFLGARMGGVTQVQTTNLASDYLDAYDGMGTDPLNSIAESRRVARLVEDVKNQYPNNQGIYFDAYIAVRAISVGLRHVRRQEGRDLLRAARRNDYRVVLSMVRLLFLRVLQYVRVINLRYLVWKWALK